MSIGEYVCLDPEHVTHDMLRGKAATIYLWAHTLNCDAS
jgi:hypothetical protein